MPFTRAFRHLVQKIRAQMDYNLIASSGTRATLNLTNVPPCVLSFGAGRKPQVVPGFGGARFRKPALDR